MTCPAQTHGRETDYINHGCTCPEARNDHRKRRKYRALYMLERGPMLQPVLPTVLRLRALAAFGYSRVDIAAHSTLSAAHLGQLRIDVNATVTQRVADEVERVYRLLSAFPGKNKRAIAHARRLGYLDPLGLEAPLDADPVVDEVAIDRYLDGDLTVTLTEEERDAAILILQQRGYAPSQMSEALHMNIGRIKRVLAGEAPKKRGPKKQQAA